MKPAIDDTFLPYRWSRGTISDDRIAFRRDDGRLSLVAETVEESAAMPRLSTGPVWELRCEQRVGEAESGIRLGCVTAMDAAIERLLISMRRINEIDEHEENVSVGTMIELLKTEPLPNEQDDWGRTPSNQLDAQSPNP